MFVWELKAALEGLEDGLEVVAWRDVGEGDAGQEPLEAVECFYCNKATYKRGFVLLVADEWYAEMADKAHDLEERVNDLEAELESLKKVKA